MISILSGRFGGYGMMLDGRREVLMCGVGFGKMGRVWLVGVCGLC